MRQNKKVPHGKKIIHIVQDQKFIDMAYHQFEEAAPSENIFLIIGEEHPLRYVEHTPVKFCTLLEAKEATADPHSSAVVLHSLRRASLIKSIPKDKTVIWLGWGYDYYERLLGSYYPDGLLLLGTENLVEVQRKAERRAEKSSALGLRSLKGVVQGVLARCIRFSDRRLLRRIDFFSPVLSSEYEMATKQNPWFQARYLEWNYGVAEDDLGWQGNLATELGGNILVGNSAEPSNNHLETFELLDRHVDLMNRKIIVPLSYGQEWYREKIIEIGTTMFGQSFVPLVDFMDRDEYMKLLQTCGFVFMNHIRQQALANLCIMLLKGARVYMNAKSPAYHWLLDKGCSVESVQSLFDIDNAVKIMLEPLSGEAREKNTSAVVSHWGREAQQAKTRRLVDVALGRREDSRHPTP